jgi:hypothetical protein
VASVSTIEEGSNPDLFAFSDLFHGLGRNTHPLTKTNAFRKKSCYEQKR